MLWRKRMKHWYLKEERENGRDPATLWLARVRPSPFIYRDTILLIDPFTAIRHKKIHCQDYKHRGQGLGTLTLTSSFVFITTVLIIISSPLQWGQGWMHSPIHSNHWAPSPRAQVRWQKHCTALAAAGSLVSGPVIMPISTSYIKPFQQP